MTKFFVDRNGFYLGGFDGAEPPEGAIEVLEAPEDARQIWRDGVWGAPQISPPDSVSARQFKLQLLYAGLLDEVEGWIAGQATAVQIAYGNSGSFVRQSPMMQAGFASLGFTSKQIDEFFVAAAML
ncbi:hypothetical protein P9272_18440 [Mesorhizobium sp. WSM4976]|uniref:hypothetical protein n=1 Tax=Mesorhizobium sp. WSM4976 TaxID=3038549 RepID=UPI002417FE10|nr:hypothetical protein [Mesorhizobium sp. WSM4976]MDG4895552.1 hypothetical protein [Mesorhizobium sp. WSM4976]